MPILRRPTEAEFMRWFREQQPDDDSGNVDANTMALAVDRWPTLKLSGHLDSIEFMPNYRIDIEDDCDLVIGVALRVLDGDVIHLHIDTADKVPGAADIPDGVSVRRGNSESTVRIPNLDRRYQTWFDVSRYAIEVVYVPLLALRVPPLFGSDTSDTAEAA